MENPMYYHVYQDAARQWRWTLYAVNHRKIADSAEGYWNKADCLAGIELVKSSGSAPVIGR
jgi:uncharacterized protein YegP (UPF0339 family)